MPICCYLLHHTNSNKTYIGYTVNFKRRLKQHTTGKKGAKYTKMWKGAVTPIAVLSGFPSKQKAMSFEWYSKRKRCLHTIMGCPRRLDRFLQPLHKPKFCMLELSLIIRCFISDDVMKRIQTMYPQLKIYCVQPNTIDQSLDC